MVADFKSYPGSLGVRGSIPLSSTKNNKRVDRKVALFVFGIVGIELKGV